MLRFGNSLRVKFGVLNWAFNITPMVANFKDMSKSKTQAESCSTQWNERNLSETRASYLSYLSNCDEQ